MYQYQTRRGFIKFISIALLICVLVISSNLFFSPVVAEEPTPTTNYPLRAIPGQDKCLVLKQGEERDNHKTEQEKFAHDNFTTVEKWTWNQLCKGKIADLSSRLDRPFARALFFIGKNINNKDEAKEKFKTFDTTSEILNILENILFDKNSKNDIEEINLKFLIDPKESSNLDLSVDIAKRLTESDKEEFMTQLEFCDTIETKQKSKKCREKYTKFINLRFQKERQLGETFLRTILLSEPFRSALPDQVIIKNAYFPETINLESAEIAQELRLENSEFKESVNLGKIKTFKDLYLDGSRFHGNLLINNAVIQGSLFLRNEQRKQDELTLDELEPFIVDGDLNLSSIQVNKNIELAISDDQRKEKKLIIDGLYKNSDARLITPKNWSYLNLFNVNKSLDLNSIQAESLKLYFDKSLYGYPEKENYKFFSTSNLINLNLKLNGSDLLKDFEIYKIDDKGNEVNIDSSDTDNLRNRSNTGCSTDLGSFNYNKANSSGFKFIRSCLNARYNQESRENLINNLIEKFKNLFLFNKNPVTAQESNGKLKQFLDKNSVRIQESNEELKEFLDENSVTTQEFLKNLEQFLDENSVTPQELNEDLVDDFFQGIYIVLKRTNNKESICDNKDKKCIDKLNSLSRSFAQAATVARNLGHYKEERDFLYKHQELQSRIEWEQNFFSPKAIELFISDHIYGFGYKRLRALKWFVLFWLLGTYLAYRQMYLKQHKIINSAIKIRDEELRDERIENEELTNFGKNCVIAVTREFISADIDFINKIIFNGQKPHSEGEGLDKKDKNLFQKNGIYINFNEIPSFLKEDQGLFTILKYSDDRRKGYENLVDESSDVFNANTISNIYFKVILEGESDSADIESQWRNIRQFIETLKARQTNNSESLKIGFCNNIFPGTGLWGIYDQDRKVRLTKRTLCNENKDQKKLSYPIHPNQSDQPKLLFNENKFWIFMLSVVVVNISALQFVEINNSAFWITLSWTILINALLLSILTININWDYLKHDFWGRILDIAWDRRVLMQSMMFSLNELIPIIELDEELKNFIFDDSKGLTRLFFQFQRIIAGILAAVLLPIFFLAG